MPARKPFSHDAKTREKIRTRMVVRRLQDHALGLIDMDAAQIRAAEILLKKTLPDLKAVRLEPINSYQLGEELQRLVENTT